MKINASIEITEGGRQSSTLNFQNDLSGQATFEEFSEFVRQAIITVAQDALKEEQAKGYFKNPTILVDNQKKAITEVRPFGEVLIAERLSTGDILTPVYENILIRSPKGQSGTYEAFNIVIYNGQEIARTMDELKNWIKTNPGALKAGDSIQFLNLTPYASKLERNNVISGGGKGIRHKASKAKGKYKGTPVRVPNGTYVLAFRASQKFLKGNVIAKFEFINGKHINALSKPRSTKGPNNGRVQDLRVTFSQKARNAFGNKMKGFYVYPSIRLTITENSL